MTTESTTIDDIGRAAAAPAARVAGSGELRREWLAAAGVVLSFATLIALFDSSQIYLKMLDHGHSWARLFTWQLLVWWSWAALTPAVFWMGGRFRLERVGRVRFALVHSASAACLAVVHMVPVMLVTVLVDPFAPMVVEERFGESFTRLLMSWLPVEMILYGAMLAAWSALDYRHRLQERELRESQLEAQLSAAALEALKLRLHPHFLFNSLNAVAALVRKNRNDAAIRTLSGLGELLRYVLDADGAQTVPLRAEIRFIERYLEIQRFRFADRLDFSLDVPEDVADLEVPSMILQPTVENALEHGIARAEGPGLIRVRAVRDGSRLLLTVSDTGPGPGRVERWGVGLGTTEARLRQHYGDAFEMRVEPGEGGGTVVTLAVPAACGAEAR